MAGPGFRLLVLGFAICSIAPSALAVSIGQVDDFQDGTTQGWGNFVSNVTGGLGGIADRYLVVTSHGFGGAGGRLIARQTAQWAGDYTGEGVTALRFDMTNLGATDLEIRLGINGAGGAFSTTSSIPLTAGSSWTTAQFSLLAGDWTAVGGSDIGLTLGNATELRILHSPTPAFGGNIGGVPPPFIEAQLGLDRISALPEPAPSAAWLVGLAHLAMRRRALRRRSAPSR